MVRAMLMLIFCVGIATAADAIGVPGSDISFVPKVQQNGKDRVVDLTITGTALRTKTIFDVKVYGMASYAENLAAIKSGEELAASEQVKLLHLVMERKVTSDDFLNAFRDAIGAVRTEREFAAEFTKLKTAAGGISIDKGQDVLLLYVPEVGTRIRIGDKVDTTISGASFGRAVWECYMGKKPIDNAMKAGLVSKVGK